MGSSVESELALLGAERKIVNDNLLGISRG